MAEEKKNTTKKTTPKKKTEVEEVKVEKRFCTNCGKELKEGEECSCLQMEQANTGAVTINGDAILNTCKNVWSTIINVFRHPSSTIEEEVESKEINKSVILTVLLAITFALYLVAIVAGFEGDVSDSFGGFTEYIYEVNYIKVFIYGILIYAIMAILPIVSALIVAKITKNSAFSFKKSFKLYITSNAPLVLAYLGMAIILFINISLLNVLGTIGFSIISIACFFNFILGFNKQTKIKDDCRSYAITGLMALWVIMTIVAFLVVVLTFAGSLISTLV